MDSIPSTHPGGASAPQRTVRVWVIKSALGAIIYGGVLFLSAGRITWLWGWLLLGLLVGSMAAPLFLLGPQRTGVLAERAKGMYDTGVPAWDKRLTTAAGGLMFLLWIVAGCDTRFQWTPSPPLPVHLGGLIVTLLGYGLFVWAMVVNPFFAEGVRVQHERGHRVVTGGPYRIVRHPGYAGCILSYTATPLLLGSAWALLPGIGLAVLFGVRTVLEDRLLRAQLRHYEAYSGQVRHRLIPGLW